MEEQPNSNMKPADGEPPKSGEKPPVPPSVGGDSVVVYGDVGMGAGLGHANITIKQAAGRDIWNIGSGSDESEDFSRFAEKMKELRDLIISARNAGELNPTLADEALDNLEQVAELVAEAEAPPRRPLLSKLGYVGDILDTAADMVEDSTVITRAIPVAALLVKIATRIF